ncbi:uncharacterized protein LOC122501735 [Leptopilina heterotoma]|uniref:uncharacterized protein LOC122501735 n=1 Tax=Leptopilina heterotoma TaxID=63436 RepID=UPI001CA99046|nr:uncharacterized protein LOC122501735 [Leptopilina heterotoma]
MNNKDSYNIKRGRCKCEECPVYCFSKDNLCSYCGCVPTKHAKIENESTAGTSVEESETSSTAPIQMREEIFPDNPKDETFKEAIFNETDESQNPFLNLPLDIQQHMNDLALLIPDTFNLNKEADIQLGLYSKMERNEFNKCIRTFADRMIKSGYTSKEDVLQISLMILR